MVNCLTLLSRPGRIRPGKIRVVGIVLKLLILCRQIAPPRRRLVPGPGHIRQDQGVDVAIQRFVALPLVVLLDGGFAAFRHYDI